MLNRFVLFLLAALPLFAGEPLQVFAAAGTMSAMKEIGVEFTKETGIPIRFNFANSGVLARQIQAGAPFDIFFSANEKWMDTVVETGAVDPESRTVLLEGELVIIVPKGRAESAPVNFSKDWKGILAVGDQSAPCGIYAKEALEKLGWWNALQGRLCRGDSVTKVLNYVALGEADAGIVYRSVAVCGSNRVEMVSTIPSELHTPIRFPVAAAKGAPPEAKRLLEMMQRESTLKLFEKQGWTPCRL